MDRTWETFEKTLWGHISNFFKLSKERYDFFFGLLLNAYLPLFYLFAFDNYILNREKGAWTNGPGWSLNLPCFWYSLFSPLAAGTSPSSSPFRLPPPPLLKSSTPMASLPVAFPPLSSPPPRFQSTAASQASAPLSLTKPAAA